MKLLEMCKSIWAVQGLIGALPGLAAIISGLGMPPDREFLFRAFVISVTFLVTSFLLTHKSIIGVLEAKTKFKYAVVAVSLSGVSLVLYLNAIDFVVIRDTLTIGNRAFDIELHLPFFPTGELATLIDVVGRHSLVSEGFIEIDIQKYRNENYMRYLFNDFLLISLYLMVVVPLNIVLTGAAILLTEGDLSD